MGIRAVCKGIGKGSMFGHGRILCVHNPFDSTLGKASDPFLNLTSLSRISQSNNPRIQNAIVSNLSGRLRVLRSKADAENIFRSIDRQMLIRVISKETFKDKGVQEAVTRFIARLSKEDLEFVALLEPPREVADFMVNDKNISKIMTRKTLVLLGLYDYGDDISSTIYSKLEKDISRSELLSLSVSKSKRILQSIYVKGRSSPQAIANVVVNLTVKIGDEYEENFFKQACSYIKGRPSEKDEILSYISKKDSKLGKAIEERLENTKHIPSPIEFGPSSDQ